MYGSVARWRVKAGKQQELEQLSEEMMREPRPGSRAVFVYRMDNDPQEYWVAGVFDSKDAYTTNSNTPEQDARFQRLRSLMDADPEWHDGEIIVARS
jgi:quinol monooxygenase YgiN